LLAHNARLNSVSEDSERLAPFPSVPPLHVGRVRFLTPTSPQRLNLKMLGATVTSQRRNKIAPLELQATGCYSLPPFAVSCSSLLPSSTYPTFFKITPRFVFGKANIYSLVKCALMILSPAYAMLSKGQFKMCEISNFLVTDN
jgi:hypothetical protein